MDNNQEGNKAPTAFLVDLVSNRKIPIATPRCRVGRDDLNDIVISGDQSISRFHFIISYENSEFTVQDAKSRHGTFLNGNQLTSSETIKDGDVLKVGVSLFWFVVEGAQGEAGDGGSPTGKVNAITADEKAAAADAKVGIRTHADGAITAPNERSQEMTQEMTRPDPALLEKLEQAANTQKAEEKIEPKTSLASLLAGANEPPAEDKKKEELAALAARDKEMLENAEKESEDEATRVENKDEPEAEKVEPAEDEAAEESEKDSVKSAEKSKGKGTGKDEKESARDEEDDSLGLTEDQIPVKTLNKPSDTVTLEAMTPAEAADIKKAAESETATGADLPAVGSTVEAKESAKAETKADIEEATESFEPDDSKTVNAGIMDSSSETNEDSKDKASSGASSPGEIQISLSLPSAGGLSGTTDSGNGSGLAKPSKSEKSEDASDSALANRVLSESSDTEVAKFIKAGANVVPDWCKRYFSDEIAKLNGELDELNEQVKIAQQKIRDVETRVALTRGIRNTLLTTTGDELVEACGKVLSLLGWKVTLTAEDKHELRLEVEDKHVCIARVIWTTTKAERSHLGQLSISQTRYWMEKGVEPKGIIIVSKISNDAPTAIGDSPEEIELNDYAAKRNVCLMSTLQLLSLYKEIALADANPDKLRTSIVSASGWLAGHNLEPGSADINDDESASSQAKALASA